MNDPLYAGVTEWAALWLRREATAAAIEPMPRTIAECFPVESEGDAAATSDGWEELSE